MKALKERVDQLGYNILALNQLKYVSGGIDTSPLPPDSCDGGCTQECFTCKNGCKSSTK